MEVSSTLREFLSDTREIVFTSDDEEMSKWNADDQYELLQCTSISYSGLNKLCDYVLDMILSSSNPKLESVRTNDKCPDWIVETIVQTFGPYFCADESTVGDEETTISYKQLKKISISVEGSNPYDEDFYRSIDILTSSIEAQARLEIVQLSRWPHCNRVVYSNL